MTGVGKSLVEEAAPRPASQEGGTMTTAKSFSFQREAGAGRGNRVVSSLLKIFCACPGEGNVGGRGSESTAGVLSPHLRSVTLFSPPCPLPRGFSPLLQTIAAHKHPNFLLRWRWQEVLGTARGSIWGLSSPHCSGLHPFSAVCTPRVPGLCRPFPKLQHSPVPVTCHRPL